MIDTPRYVFERDKIIESYNRMKNLMKYCDIFYSFKANSEIEVAKVLNEINSGFEVASLGEFKKLIEINTSVERIICGLPIKKIEMIQYLYDNGCRYFVFDDIREFKKLQEYAPEAKKILRLYICDLAPRCIEYGMTMDKIKYYNSGEKPLLKMIDGISFHISENTNIDNLLKALDRVELLLPELDTKKSLVLNIGGSYDPDVSEEFYAILQERLKRIKDRYNLTIIAEPGSAIINKAGKIITRVIMIKEREGFKDVYIDAGIPTGLMRQPGYVKIINPEREPTRRKIYRFLDITSLHRPLFQFFLKFDLQENDILELGDCGAYTVCYSNIFHSWPKPEVVIE